MRLQVELSGVNVAAHLPSDCCVGAKYHHLDRKGLGKKARSSFSNHHRMPEASAASYPTAAVALWLRQGLEAGKSDVILWVAIANTDMREKAPPSISSTIWRGYLVSRDSWSNHDPALSPYIHYQQLVAFPMRVLFSHHRPKAIDTKSSKSSKPFSSDHARNLAILAESMDV